MILIGKNLSFKEDQKNGHFPKGLVHDIVQES